MYQQNYVHVSLLMVLMVFNDTYVATYILLGLGDFCDCENNRDVVFIIMMLMSTCPQS